MLTAKDAGSPRNRGIAVGSAVCNVHLLESWRNTGRTNRTDFFLREGRTPSHQALAFPRPGTNVVPNLAVHSVPLIQIPSL